MLQDNDENTRKNPPMKNADWILIVVLVLILLISFPVLWRWYRFIFPFALVGLIMYLAFRFIQSGNTALPDGSMQKFTDVWTTFISSLRASFRKIIIGIIIFITFSVGGILFYGKVSKGKDTTKRMILTTQSLEKYKSNFGSYPTGLADLVGNDPLKKEWFRDYWGNEIDYKTTNNGLGYELRSPGEDGKSGSTDDVVMRK
jgi:hypothetical protein